MLAHIMFNFLSQKFFCWMKPSTYPSVSAEDFHPPWRYNLVISTPESANNERPKQYPVYDFGSGSIKNVAMFYCDTPSAYSYWLFSCMCCFS